MRNLHELVTFVSQVLLPSLSQIADIGTPISKPAGRSLTCSAGFRPVARVRTLAVAHSLHALHRPRPGGEDEEFCTEPDISEKMRPYLRLAELDPD